MVIYRVHLLNLLAYILCLDNDQIEACVESSVYLINLKNIFPVVSTNIITYNIQYMYTFFLPDKTLCQILIILAILAIRRLSADVAAKFKQTTRMISIIVVAWIQEFNNIMKKLF